MVRSLLCVDGDVCQSSMQCSSLSSREVFVQRRSEERMRQANALAIAVEDTVVDGLGYSRRGIDHQTLEDLHGGPCKRRRYERCLSRGRRQEGESISHDVTQ